MKKILYAVFIAVLINSGFSSTSLAQDGLPAGEKVQQDNIEQNFNDMVKLLEELQNDEEMSQELLVPKDKDAVNKLAEPTPLERDVKPDEKLVPALRPVEKNSAEKDAEKASEVVGFETGVFESPIPPGDRSLKGDSGKKDEIKQNVNDMVKLLEEMQKKELLLPEDGLGKTEKPDPTKHFVKPGGILIPIPDPVEKNNANNIEPADEVVRYDPDDPDSHFQLGLEHWLSKNLDEAIYQFEEVVRLEPENAHAYWNLGLLYDERDRGPEAIANIKKAEAIYSKYHYSAYVNEAKKRLQSFSEKYDNPSNSNPLPYYP